MNMGKICVKVLITCLFLIGINSGVSFAETPTPTPADVTPTPDNSAVVGDLNSKIRDLEAKVSSLQSQERSLSSQISVMDNQIKLTEYRIDYTKSQISQLSDDISTASNKINHLEGSLTEITKTLLGRISVTYQLSTIQPLQLLLSSHNFSDFVARTSYIRIVQANDKKLMYNTIQAKNDYSNQKQIFEDKKQQVLSLQTQLEDYTKQLDQEKSGKERLLSETQGSEANYQRLLTQARAQLAGFSTFTSSQGGASILPPQPSPDGWYFNQRDERWGNRSIGVSGEPVWKYGCLLTSMAMLLKQRGESVTPADIAGNTSYYFSNTAYMSIPWGGGKFTSIWSRDIGAIDAKLAAGKPVIVGLNAGQYGTHFIVLKSGSNGSYMMNDPWYGPDLAFTSHYSQSQIFQYGFLN